MSELSERKKELINTTSDAQLPAVFVDLCGIGVFNDGGLSLISILEYVLKEGERREIDLVSYSKEALKNALRFGHIEIINFLFENKKTKDFLLSEKDFHFEILNTASGGLNEPLKVVKKLLEEEGLKDYFSNKITHHTFTHAYRSSNLDVVQYFIFEKFDEIKNIKIEQFFDVENEIHYNKTVALKKATDLKNKFNTDLKKDNLIDNKNKI